MKSIFILFILITVVLITTGAIMAQPPGMPTVPSQSPIDGGLGWLAAAGGAYVLKKLRDKKASNQRNEK